MNRLAIGMVSALAGAACWGFNANCMQYVFSAYGVPVLFVSAWRMFVAGAVFVAALLVVQRENLLAMLRDVHSVKQLLLFGLVGLYFCQTTYMLAIDATNAGTGTVLQAFNVVVVLLYTCWTARRAPRPLECGAVALALAATVLIATKGDLTSLHIPAMGLFWGLASAVAVAFYVCYPRPLLARWGAPPVVAVGMFVGGVVAIVVYGANVVLGVGEAADFSWVAGLDARGVAFLLVIALVGTLAAFTLYLYGVSLVGSVRGSLLGTFEPAAATVISAVWLGTQFTWADWAGLVMMIATVFIVALLPALQEKKVAQTKNR